MRARALWQQCLALAQELGDRSQISVSLCSLGYVAYLDGHLSTARAFLEQSLPLARAVGNKAVTGWVQTHLAEVAGDQGDLDAASAHLEEALSVWRLREADTAIAWSLHKQGRIAQHRGDLVAAGRRFAESLTLCTELVAAGRCSQVSLALFHEQGQGNDRPLAECVEGLAAVAGGQGYLERACRLFGAAAAMRETGMSEAGAPLAPVYRAEHERQVATLRDTLGEKAFTAAWAEGQAMTPEQAAAYALA